jgi:aerobic-type carbon monoxide dehydrogenase small subunit (CoxS/CutS family)
MMPTTREMVTITVNGRRQSREVECRRLLSDFLRHDLGLTGTHVGCEQGVCGSCTVVLDGQAVRSCLILAVQVDGAQITTVEGLGTPDAMHEVQEAFWQNHGLQCGFCTPGILMTVDAARAEGASLQSVENDLLSGHMCRCTGYSGIRAAVRALWDAARP